MCRRLIEFIIKNRISLIAMLSGGILGYIHWYHYGCYWGSYPFSSEFWVNCCYGSLFAGFISCLVQENGI